MFIDKNNSLLFQYKQQQDSINKASNEDPIVVRIKNFILTLSYLQSGNNQVSKKDLDQKC